MVHTHENAREHADHEWAADHDHEALAIRAVVITVSDRSSRGERPDASGPRAVDMLLTAGYDVGQARIVPDGVESVRDAIRSAIECGALLVITSGGTGVSPRDLTPEGTRPLLVMELPGISEALRREGEKQSKMAVISRGLAGIAGVDGAAEQRALVVNLPGSERAVVQGLEVLLPLVPHIIDQLAGGDHRPVTTGR